ncbi:unnamed protein product [Pylaiella littoralis]
MRRTMLSMESLQEEEGGDDDDDDDDHDDDEGEEELREASMWRSVADPHTGKTYYYHVISRESVWDKPLALCSARESRADVARRKDRQRSFFADMEGNILTKIGQGILFGGATPPSMPSTPAGEKSSFSMATGGTEEPAGWQQLARLPMDRLCRTISTMDDSVVVEQLCAVSPRIIADGALSCSSPETSSNYFLGSGGCASPPVLPPLGPAAGRSSDAECAPAARTCPALGANDLPVLRRLGHSSSSRSVGGNDHKPTTGGDGGEAGGGGGGGGRLSSADERNPVTPAVSFSSGATATSNNSFSGQEWLRRRDYRRQLSSGSDSGSISAAGELAGADYFVAAAAAAAAEADAGGNGTGQSSVGRRFDGGGGSGGSGDHGGKPAAGAESGRGVVRRSLAPSLFRRNSTSTIYLAAHDTLSDPDLDATIRCVCAVLRAHMIAGLADAREDCVSVGVGVGGTSSGSSSISGGGGVAPPEEGGVKGKGKGNQGDGMRGGEGRETWRGESVRVFDDPPEEGAPGPGATAGGSGGGSGAAAAAVPPLRDITAFYRNLYHRTCLKFDSIVLSLIYVERLMKETKGALRPQPWNWKSLIMSALVLSSKVWDDHSMWNRDFSEVSPSFSLGRLNQLEVAVLGVLRFNVKVLSSEYAKYYFHLRAMCVRGGLSEGHAPIHPLDLEGIRELEAMSSKVARDSAGKQYRSSKAMSIHDVNDAKLLKRVATSGYTFTDKHAPPVSLEQVVTGDRRRLK